MPKAEEVLHVVLPPGVGELRPPSPKSLWSLGISFSVAWVALSVPSRVEQCIRWHGCEGRVGNPSERGALSLPCDSACGRAVSPCLWWVQTERWNEQRENGTFPGPVFASKEE